MSPVSSSSPTHISTAHKPDIFNVVERLKSEMLTLLCKQTVTQSTINMLIIPTLCDMIDWSPITSSKRQNYLWITLEISDVSLTWNSWFLPRASRPTSHHSGHVRFHSIVIQIYVKRIYSGGWNSHRSSEIENRACEAFLRLLSFVGAQLTLAGNSHLWLLKTSSRAIILSIV